MLDKFEPKSSVPYFAAAVQNLSRTNSLTRTRSGAYGDRPQKANLDRTMSRAASLTAEVRSTMAIDLEVGEERVCPKLEVGSVPPSTTMQFFEKKSSVAGLVSTTRNVSLSMDSAKILRKREPNCEIVCFI